MSETTAQRTARLLNMSNAQLIMHYQDLTIERDSLAEQNMALMNALEMLQGSWIEYGLPKTDRSFQISEAALATGGK